MSFEQMMAELRTEYVAAIPEKIKEIQTLMEKKDASALREAFHKLKGSGKTYGLAEVSEVFEVCEKLCLNKPNFADQVAQIALVLLREIYESRKKGEAYSVSDKPAFLKLRSL